MIELYTAATPNGWKASIALEEMGLPYEVTHLDLTTLEQKRDWFLKINPNGRIPAIIDRNESDFAVFESGAILIYLADRTGQFLPTEFKARSRVIQWLMFQMGGVGPMQGQANVFYRYAPEKIDYAIHRYQHECRRLFEVLDRQLADNEYLAGDYSIADMATWPWVQGYEWTGLSVKGLDHLKRWLAAVGARSAVIRGKAVPETDETESKEQVEEKIQSIRGFLTE